MDARLVVLKLFMDELGVPAKIETINDRKRFQKTVYLGQLTGVDLGYRFGWYLMGPYSPALAWDYVNLAESIVSGNRDFEGQELQESVKNNLRAVQPLLDPPQNVELSQEDWLELVSSLHYLLSIRKLTKDQAIEILKKEKPQLLEYVSQAEERLRDVTLLPQAE